MNTPTPVLEVRAVCKSFEAGKPVLADVSLAVEEQEFLCIMGPSGSGKSTLLYCMSGIEPIDSGSILFEGQDLATLSPEALTIIRRDRFGFVFQQPHLLKNLNLLDNIVATAMLARPQEAAAIHQRARALMEIAGIADLAARDIRKVSGGQLQRAGICRALMNSPRVVFGDEPTGALNSATSAAIMELFSTLNRQGTTLVIVTHDAWVAARANRVVFLLDGGVRSTLRFPRYQGDSTQLKARVEQVMAEMQMSQV